MTNTNLSQPRPATDYTGPVACPQCGEHRPAGRTEVYCVPCQNIGHNYRLMGVEELRWTAEREARDGYPEVAERRRKIAATLEAAPDAEVFHAPTRAGGVRARRLRAGEIIVATDLYYSTARIWAEVPEPCVGRPVNPEVSAAFARPVTDTPSSH